MSIVTVALVDDHPLMVEAVAALFSRAPGLLLLATGSTANDIIEICSRHKPDVLVSDLSMSGNVYAALAAVAKNNPATKIVAFTAATGVDTAIRALDAGANGYVLKGSNPSELLQAIDCVRRGETYITQNFASQVIAALRDTSLRRIAAEAVNLTIRETQIVRLLFRGQTNKEIAIALKISEKTVKHYMTILMQKLHARNRLEVVIAAQKLGDDEPAVGSVSGAAWPTAPSFAL
jgi:DNA-binding NarL/FixJ family response regulator